MMNLDVPRAVLLNNRRQWQYGGSQRIATTAIKEGEVQELLE